MKPTTRPPMMPVIKPAAGGAPEAMAMPMQSGSATRKTTTDARASRAMFDESVLIALATGSAHRALDSEALRILSEFTDVARLDARDRPGFMGPFCFSTPVTIRNDGTIRNAVPFRNDLLPRVDRAGRLRSSA